MQPQMLVYVKITFDGNRLLFDLSPGKQVTLVNYASQLCLAATQIATGIWAQSLITISTYDQLAVCTFVQLSN